MTTEHSTERAHLEWFNYHTLTPDELATYHNQGYLLLKAVLKPAGVDRMVTECMESRATTVRMDAGDCLIFTCWTLHKSEGNMSFDRDRRVLFLRYADADAVEVYNDGKPRLGRVVRGRSRFPEVAAYDQDLL